MRIIKIETAICSNIQPNLLSLRVHTNTGVIGCGETYYAPHAVAAMIHDWMARRLLGADPLAIESHWRFFYERAANFGTKGCELRAISAIDLALWDIFGQMCDQPVWQLLGGKVHDYVPVYNSSGGPNYGARDLGHTDPQGWPGYGDIGSENPLNDYWSVVNKPVEYAQELINQGYKALKMWTLDFAAHKSRGGMYLSDEDLEIGLLPMRKIRERFGKQIELILDGHGFFQLPVALRIAEALQEIKPLWVEDIIRPDCIDTICQFRKSAGIPVAVSEMLIGLDEYRMVLEKQGADYIMIDPTWVGGISQTKRIAQLAQVYNIPVTMHDCTGPLTLLAGLQVAFSTANVAWQETVRAHVHSMYPKLIDDEIKIDQGKINPLFRSGIGAAWLPQLFVNEHNEIRVSEV